MSSGPWTVYDSHIKEVLDGTQNLNSDTFNVILAAVSYTPDVAADALYSAVSAHELLTNYGYTVGGEVTVATILSILNGGNVAFSNVSWAVLGGDIVCHYSIIRNATSGGLVAYALLDDTPASITVTDGNPLNLDLSTNTVYDHVRV